MDGRPAGIAKTTAQKHRVEGIDHPVQRTASSSKNTVEGIDHPGWRPGWKPVNECQDRVEGIYHPDWGPVNSSKNTGENIDHPYQRQIDSRMAITGRMATVMMRMARAVEGRMADKNAKIGEAVFPINEIMKEQEETTDYRNTGIFEPSLPVYDRTEEQ